MIAIAMTGHLRPILYMYLFIMNVVSECNFAWSFETRFIHVLVTFIRNVVCECNFAF